LLTMPEPMVPRPRNVTLLIDDPSLVVCRGETERGRAVRERGGHRAEHTLATVTLKAGPLPR
ncbi:MAG: hypothetical protein R6V28_06205, partial [Nitriliruptoraceae bacterium]